jgi:4-amino-4-deoxy-L-arabinose transferase-like glycosyltransferase
MTRVTRLAARWEFWGCIAIVALAAALRFYGIGHDLPYSPAVDEPAVVGRAVDMMKTGDLNPHFFDYGGLVIYLHLVVAVGRFIAGALAGEWNALDAAGTYDFILWSRVVTAAFGTLTVLLVYFIGRRQSAATGLIGALLVAVFGQHVRESHFALTDVPLTLAVVAAWLASLRAADRPSLARFALAGGLAGLAASAKYPGVFAVLLPLIVIWTTAGSLGIDRVKATLAAIGACAAAFLVTSPYTVLDLPAFLNAFAYLVNVYKAGAPPAEPPWLLYIKHFRNGGGYAFMYAVVPATAYTIWLAARRDTRVYALLALVVPAILYAFISRQQIVYGRYLLPILPFVAIMVGGLAARLIPLAPRPPLRLAAAAVVVALLSVQPGVQAVRYAHTLGLENTTRLADEWVRTHVKPGEKIALETRLFVPDSERQTVVFVSRLIDYPPEYYRDEGFTYLVAADQAFGAAFRGDQSADAVAYRQLVRQMEPVQQWVPGRNQRGPEIRIFRVMR